MNKIYLVIYSKKLKRNFTKYFDTEWEKDKYKRKIFHVKDWILIEDSEDIIYDNVPISSYDEERWWSM